MCKEFSDEKINSNDYELVYKKQSFNEFENCFCEDSGLCFCKNSLNVISKEEREILE